MMQARRGIASTQATRSAVASPGMILSTTKHLPLQVRVRPARRFPWLWKRGWLLTFHILQEQQRVHWEPAHFFLHMAEVCEFLNIGQDEEVWSCIEPQAYQEKQASHYVPFMMF